MKPLLSLLFVMALRLFSAYAYGLEADRGLDIEKVSSVTMSGGAGWIITVFEDGSAKVEYGSGPLDNAKALAGAVNFDQLRHDVEAQLASSSDASGPVKAAIRNPGQQSVTLRPLKSSMLWNRVVAQLNGKLQSPAPHRFESLLKKAPLAIPE